MKAAKISLIALLACLSLELSAKATDAVNWRNNLDAAKVEAAQSGKLVVLHFFTTTCSPCQMLDQNVFSLPQIGEALERNYVPVKVDAGNAPALAQAYQIDTVPADIVLSPEGGVVAHLSCPQNASDYLNQLTNLSQHYQLYAAKQGQDAHPAVQSAYAGLQVGNYRQQAGAQPTEAAPRQVEQQPPASMNNPYAAPAQNQVTQTTPQPSTAPRTTLPANAMPNSYRRNTPATANNSQLVTAQTTSAGQRPATNNQPAVVQNQFASNPTQQQLAQNTTNHNTQVTRTSHQSLAKELPPGCPPLAFDGYCPVSLKSEHKWVEGDLQYGAIHRGRTFLFASKQQREQFLTSPDVYCPVFSGMDPVLLLEENKLVEGSRRYGFDYRGAFYLFSSAQSMNQFKSEPDKYAAGVRQAMARMENASNGTVLR